MIAELLDDSLTQVAQAVRSRRVSATALTEACLDAIESRADTLKCFVRVDADAALARARQLDRDLAQNRIHGPLHGMPLAHKDMFYRPDAIVACGSKILAEHRPTTTATVLARLEAAGAINIGALHMAEFALSPTGYNEHLGHGRNPWATEHITGGSSSGSGAAVGARLVFGALGSDTGGSVRIPSACCGVTGIKPTQARVSTYGVMPLSPSLDCVGVLARSSRDCARLLGVMAGADPADESCSKLPVDGYERSLDLQSQNLRIAVPPLDGAEAISPAIGALIDEALDVFRRTGVSVHACEAPNLDAITAPATVVLGSEAAALHRPWLHARLEDYGRQVRRRIERGLLYPATQYFNALRLRPILLKAFIERHLANADALLLPTLPEPVPTIAETIAGGDAAVEARFANFSIWTRGINYLGLPALSVPCGFTAGGLPAGFQLIGRPYAEGVLFGLADRYQLYTDWHRRAPPK